MPNFPGYTTFYNLGPTTNLELSLALYLTDAFVSVGAYDNVLGSGDADYSDRLLAQCKAVTHGGYGSGQYWQSRNNQWIFSSGLSVPGGMTAPIMPSGIYVREPGADFVYYPSGDGNGNYNYTFDFHDGAIFFNNDSVVHPDSLVLAPHSYSIVHVDIADRNDKFERLINSDTKSEALGSGMAFPERTDIAMSAVFIEENSNTTGGGELGGGKLYRGNLTFHIFADTKIDRDNISNQLAAFSNKVIRIIDFNTAPFPLNDVGEPHPAWSNYDGVRASNQYRGCYFEEVRVRKFRSTAEFYRGEVHADIEMRYFS